MPSYTCWFCGKPGNRLCWHCHRQVRPGAGVLWEAPRDSIVLVHKRCWRKLHDVYMEEVHKPTS